MSEGVNIYDGDPCPTCSAPLTVAEVHGTSPCLTTDGRSVNTATYECTGPERHRFGTWLDFRAAGPGRWVGKLIPKPSA
jgi:hypothetical protein